MHGTALHNMAWDGMPADLFRVPVGGKLCSKYNICRCVHEVHTNEDTQESKPARLDLCKPQDSHCCLDSFVITREPLRCLIGTLEQSRTCVNYLTHGCPEGTTDSRYGHCFPLSGETFLDLRQLQPLKSRPGTAPAWVQVFCTSSPKLEYVQLTLWGTDGAAVTPLALAQPNAHH
jgi:hypothetical protein